MLGTMQATQAAWADITPFVLPSTLLRLLSLGDTVITVAEIFSKVLPFQAAGLATYHKYAQRIRDDETLPLPAAAVWDITCTAPSTSITPLHH